LTPSGSTVSGKAQPTPLEKEIDKTFSQHWSIYRIAMHEKGGLELAAEMEWKYSTRQMLKLIEMLDVHDALLQQAKNKAEANKNKPK
jgi:hypothetical protein